MELEIIELNKKDDLKKYKELQKIINDNLAVNGGTLLQNNLLTQDFEWSHLFLLKDQNRVIGFALLRKSHYDQHHVGYDKYYYISDIVLLKKYQHRGLGTMLLNYVLESIVDLPIVSSVRKNNAVSLKLFNKLMSPYLETNNYYRFVDRNHILNNDSGKNK